MAGTSRPPGKQFWGCSIITEAGAARVRRCGAALAAALASLLAGCTGVIFQPQRAHQLDLDELGVEHRNVDFRAADGMRLHAWFLPPTDQPAQGTVVLAHGNGGNISTHIPGVAWLREYGYNVFVFDYRGYGRSAGTPTMAGVHGDTRAALRAARRVDDLPADRIVLVGQSLGGAVATVATAGLPPEEAPGALVIDSAPSDYRAIAQEKAAAFWPTWPLQMPLSWLITDEFAAIDAAGELPAIPKLFIGNRRDQTVPFRHTRRLYAAARTPRACWRISDPRHLATFALEPVRQRLIIWLERALSEPPSVAQSLDCPPAAEAS